MRGNSTLQTDIYCWTKSGCKNLSHSLSWMEDQHLGRLGVYRFHRFVRGQILLPQSLTFPEEDSQLTWLCYDSLIVELFDLRSASILALASGVDDGQDKLSGSSYM